MVCIIKRVLIFFQLHWFRKKVYLYQYASRDSGVCVLVVQ